MRTTPFKSTLPGGLTDEYTVDIKYSTLKNFLIAVYLLKIVLYIIYDLYYLFSPDLFLFYTSHLRNANVFKQHRKNRDSALFLNKNYALASHTT